MSLHLGAGPGEIAPIVLITGDPLRARYYAKKFLDNAACYNQIRGMLGFTGTYQGLRISIQGTGIGIPSTALYVQELIKSYDVNCIMRVGTCGALRPNLELGDLIVADEAMSDSSAIVKFQDLKLSRPAADPGLLQLAEQAASQLKLRIRKGLLFSTDLFYSEDGHRYEKSIQQGVLGVDMETSMLYAMGKYYHVQALSILTVSDNLITGKEASAEQREKQADDMIRLALETIRLQRETE